MAEDKVFYAVKGRLVFHRPQCRFISAYDQSRLTKVSDYGSGIVITTCAALWRIYRSGSKLFLHHEKWTFRAAKYSKCAGFIIRDKEFSDISEAVFYAYCHDKRYLKSRSNTDTISDIRI